MAASSTSKGSSLRSRKRRIGSASLSLAGRVSKSSRSTLAARSGMTSDTCRSRSATSSSVWRSAATTGLGSGMFGELSPGTSSPGSRPAKAVMAAGPRSLSWRAATTPSALTSQASRGRKVTVDAAGHTRKRFSTEVGLLSPAISTPRFVGPPPSAGRLDECDLVDLFQCSQAPAHAIQRRFAQELHALLLRQLADLGARPLLEDHFTDRVGEVEQLVDRGPAAE